ncbi:MAG: SCO family protein [Actinobacteria bacterium]|nr:SCO family protein [Actinomycetota bacterium]
MVRCFYYALSSLRAGRRLIPLLLAGIAVAAAGCATASGGTSASQRLAAEANPALDPGSSLGGSPAPNFTLTDQYGRAVSLRSFRGKVVILAFTDSQCTNVCPLTTQSMLAAKDLLGAAGNQVQLLGVNANPDATSVSDVMSYSQTHGLVNHWEFVTGSPTQLKTVWQSYHIAAQIEHGQIDHTPAVFVIDTRGREQKVYLTQMNYASITQAGQVMAQDVSSLLPGHPPLARTQSLAHITGLGPAKAATLPVLPSGSLTLGPGKPHLIVFFATWLTETSDLRSQLTALNQYVLAARAGSMPDLVAVDEESSEPSAATVSAYLAGLDGALTYPVALDQTGRVADGYGVQDQPWFALTSASGAIVWKHDGWLPPSQLIAAVRAAAG